MKKNEHTSFAMEVCKKLKKKAKIWFTIALIEFVLLIGIVFANADVLVKVLKLTYE